MKNDYMQTATEEALYAFWDAIVKRYPQATSGDLSPMTSFRLHEAAEAAVEEWVWANVPETDNQ